MTHRPAEVQQLLVDFIAKAFPASDILYGIVAAQVVDAGRLTAYFSPYLSKMIINPVRSMDMVILVRE